MQEPGLQESTPEWLLDAFVDGVVLIDSEWCVRFTNRAAETVLGTERAALVGKVLGRDLPEPPPERWAIYREVMQNRSRQVIRDVQSTYAGLEDQIFDVEVHPSPTGGIAIVFRAVTERARMEKEARSRAEEAERRIRESEALREIGRDLLSRAEPAKVLERIAHHTRELLGAGYAAVAVVEESGQTEWLAIVGNQADTWKSHRFPSGKGTAGRVVAANRPLIIENFPDSPQFPADEFPVHVSEAMRSAVAVPLHTPAGEAFGALIAGWRTPVRVTEREVDLALALAQPASLAIENARLLNEAREAQQEAEAANLAKSQFLATMSHEIRTPINAIMGYTDLLELGLGGPVTDAQRSYLERVRTSSSHLLGLVNEVLDLAKVEAGRMHVQRERLPVRTTIAEAVALIAPQMETQEVQIAEEWDCDPEVAYTGDAHRVRQILVNLLSNAVKFTSLGDRVTVRCDVAEAAPSEATLTSEGPWVTISVGDRGIGIAEERIGEIFEPFVQVDNGYTRERSGTGLGLTISRHLARLMGGDITVQSQPGQGSCFTLWLPAAERIPANSALDAPITDWIDGVAHLPALIRVGEILTRHSASVVEKVVQRLRSDPQTPNAHYLHRSQLEDHMATFLSDIGLSLTKLGTGGVEAATLRDGSEIWRVMSERHGAQRARLGWTVAALQREYTILREEADKIVRQECGVEPDAGLDPALAILHRLLEHTSTISLGRLRAAAEVEQV
jgi:signal transduction histidine kinase